MPEIVKEMLRWEASGAAAWRRDPNFFAIDPTNLHVLDSALVQRRGLAAMPKYFVSRGVSAEVAAAMPSDFQLPSVDTGALPTPSGFMLWDLSTPIYETPPSSDPSDLTPPSLGGAYWQVDPGTGSISLGVFARDASGNNYECTGRLEKMFVRCGIPTIRQLPGGSHLDAVGACMLFGTLATLHAGLGDRTATLDVTHQGRKRKSGRRRPAPPVRVITMSARAATPSTANGAQPREYENRWSVAGHARNQAYGPGRTLRRPVWVASYIKGPADKPVAPAKQVVHHISKPPTSAERAINEEEAA